MKTKSYQVLITVAGVSHSLGAVTQFTNASLVKVGAKPVISHIIEGYPPDTQFIVTIGHHGEQVQDFVTLAYPDRRIIFVPVDRYDGPGSSLSYSMLQAADFLDSPFIYHAGDTIIRHLPPYPAYNWVGGFRGHGSPNYASFDANDGHIRSIYDKGILQPDFLHIGLVGVHDHAAFWRSKREVMTANPGHPSLGDLHTINKMIEGGATFKIHEVPAWFDTGNPDSLGVARGELGNNWKVLDKLGESIFTFDGTVVKFFHDPQMVADRVARGRTLKGLAPDILGSGKYFFSYRYVEGDLYADVANPANFRDLLLWAKKKLWRPVEEIKPEEFKKICHDFYYTKSVERVQKLLASRNIKDATTIINGETIPPVLELIKSIDFDRLDTTDQTHFHGDFILDNIIKTKDSFRLLDWRQNFGGLIKAGDKYYDLAKLNHNLTVNHGIVDDNLFTIKIDKNQIECDILRKASHVECQRVLFDFLQQEGLDEHKVRILTALIWLNSSPLHHAPYDLFLFYFGKLNLWRAINEKQPA